MSASVEITPSGDSDNTYAPDRPDLGAFLDSDGDVRLKLRSPDRALCIDWSDWQILVAAMNRAREIHDDENPRSR